MYSRFPTLSEENLEALLALRRELPMVESLSFRRRMGANGVNNLSVYLNSRSFNWTRTQRELFRKAMPDVQIDRALVYSFLEIPPKVGFLDRMITWVDTRQAGTMLSYALKGTNEILLDDKPVQVARGEGIGFSLRTVHEINKSESGQLWACIMVQGDHADFMP